MVIDRIGSYSGTFNPNRVRYTDYHKNDARGKKIKEFGRMYKTIDEWKELNKGARAEIGRKVDYYSFQGHKKEFSQSLNVRAKNKYTKLNKRLDDKSVHTKGQKDPFSELFQKKVITEDTGNMKYQKPIEELYKDDKRELFDDQSKFKEIEESYRLPAEQQKKFYEVKQSAETTLINSMKGDIGSLMLNNIKAGAKRSSLETLEFIPAKKQSVFTNQIELKKKYKVLKPSEAFLKLTQEKESKRSSLNGAQTSDPQTPSASITSTAAKNITRSRIPNPAVEISPELPHHLRQWNSDMKSKRIHSTGLYNRGNTCFLNATIQVLTHTAPLWNYLIHLYGPNHRRKDQHPNQNNPNKFNRGPGGFGHNKFFSGFNNNNHSNGAYNMQDSLLAHFRYVHKMTVSSGPYTTQAKAIAPQKILEGLHIVTNNRMRIGHQEDAHEYLRYVLDSIQKNMLVEAKNKNVIVNKITKECLHVKSTTFLHRIFGGYTRSKITCTVCSNQSDCFEPILDLQIDLKNCSHVSECLYKFNKKDILSGDNAYKCECCQKRVDATKQMSIEKAPQVLTLHLKRFDGFGPFGGGKIGRMINYPSMLDLNRYMSPELKCKEMKYELYGVLVHSGYSCNSGHYYSYCKSPQGTWFCFNDNSVTAVKSHVALQQSEAYLLFYNKVSSNFIGGDPYASAEIKKQEAEMQAEKSKPVLSMKEKLLEQQARKAKELAEKNKNLQAQADKNGNFIGPMPPGSSSSSQATPSNKPLSILERKMRAKNQPSNHSNFSKNTPNSAVVTAAATTSSKINEASQASTSSNQTQIETEKSPKSEIGHQMPSKSSGLTGVKKMTAILADYDDSSTSSFGSAGSTSSKTNLKREKFLKRKAERMAKLGDVEQNSQDSMASKSELKKSPEKEKLTEQQKQEQLNSKNSSFFKLHGKSWDNTPSSMDKQIDKELKSQNKSKLDKFDLEYDEERIDRAERKFKKRQEKIQNRKEGKVSGINADTSRNKFQEIAEKKEREESRDRNMVE